ncbi:MAG: hypothetical protein L0Y35_00600 [Flammeovirgaceae bacterium]|nr:hypothetical protein [Flammeovirgaceae bacterium]
MNKLRFLFQLTLVLLASSCKLNNDPGPKIFDLDYMAHIYPENFVSDVTNPYFPLSVGSTFSFTGETSEGTETTEIEVLADTRIVMGIACTVIRDRVYLNGELIEDTRDWYAQDKDGNVWYFGEEVDNYIDGVLDNHYGSWEAGVDGAEPGIIMLGNPVIGLKYRQEHFVGEAEDHGEVVSKDESVSVIAGSFTGCIKIEDTNPLDPNFLEYKYFAPGVGHIKTEKIDLPVETEELESYDIK